MTQSAHVPLTMGRSAAKLAPAAWVLALGAALAGAAAWIVDEPTARLGLLSAAVTLIALLMLVAVFGRRETRRRRDAHDRIAEFVAQDAAPSFTTDRDGQIGYQNQAAEARFGVRNGEMLVRALDDLFANPSAVLYRLQSRALAVGAAREDVVTRRGHVRLSVHQVGEDGFLWRLEEMVDRSAGGRGAETLSLPMLTVSKSGTVLFMNDAMRRIVGGRVRTLDRIFPVLPLRSGEETELSGHAGPLRAIVAELEGASGRREIYLLPVPDSQPHSAMGGAAFESLPVPLLRLAPDGEILSANRLARKLLDLPAARADSAGGTLQELLEGPGRSIPDWLGDAMAGLADSRPQVLRRRGRDSDSYLQVTLRRFSEDGRPHLVAVLSDATRMKELEAQFNQSQKMQAIGQLAGGVAHDFNNLLTAISGHCDLLLLRHDSGDPDYADLVEIHQNANRAASLVGQLLAFSRKQTLMPELLDLRDTMADLTHLLNRLVGERVSLTVSSEDDLAMVRADKRQLEQVVMNLVVNARDAMPDGGTIRVEIANSTLRSELQRDRATVPPGDYVVLRLADEGTGIPSENLQKVFEPFYTTKRSGEGTGLGLSTAYGIVKQSGGFIFVDSLPGSGTTFTIYLPASVRMASDAPAIPARSGSSANPRGMVDLPAAGAAAADAAASAEERSETLEAIAGLGMARGSVILLVEDEAPVRAFAARALRLQGHQVIEAETAEDALDALQDPELHVDLFVTDVIMPGMDGPSWVREALKDRPGTRVVFVSGYAEEAFETGSARVPNAVFLPKPFSLTELTETVQRQIH